MRNRIKKVARVILLLSIILFIFITSFYFWGSSAKLSVANEALIQVNKKASLAPAKDTLRVMTYNMGYLSGMTNNLAVDRSKDLFDNNENRLSSLLTKEKVDICCFQEIDFHSGRSYYVDQLSKISSVVNYPYASRVVNWDKTYVPFPYWPLNLQFGEILSGQAIVSKYPIQQNEAHVLEKADYPFYYNAFYLDRLAQVNLLRIGLHELVIINVHLEAFDARTREKQADQLIELYKRYEAVYPVLMLGDFNSTPPGSRSPYMEENTIEKIVAVEGINMAIRDSLYLMDEENYFTFNSVAPYIKIDYIFYNEEKIKVLDPKVLREAGDISDHLPIMADIVFLD